MGAGRVKNGPRYVENGRSAFVYARSFSPRACDPRAPPPPLALPTRPTPLAQAPPAPAVAPSPSTAPLASSNNSSRALFMSPEPQKGFLGKLKRRLKKKSSVPVKERLEASKENAPKLYSADELTMKLLAAEARRSQMLEARKTPQKKPSPAKDDAADKAAALAAKLEAAGARREEALSARKTPRKTPAKPDAPTPADKAAALSAKLEAASARREEALSARATPRKTPAKPRGDVEAPDSAAALVAKLKAAAARREEALSARKTPKKSPWKPVDDGSARKEAKLEARLDQGE